MPLRKIKLQPGVNLEQSPTLNQTQLAQSNLIRFYGGLPQKLGGWMAMNTGIPFVGTCRGMKGWADLVGNGYIGIGTEQRLEVFFLGTMNDITPLAGTDNVAVNFSTVAGSPLVTIVDASYNPSAGDWIYLATQVSVGGIILFGFLRVASVTNSTTYVVTAAQNATTNASNAGQVPSYTTVNGQSQVKVILPNHGLVTGGIFNAVVSTTVATIVIAGLYNVTVLDPNTFNITGSTTANAGATASENAGNAQIQYLLPSGGATTTALFGFGAGQFGAGPFGGSSNTGQVTAPLRQWSLDNFGRDLIASPSNGKIYYWQPPVVQPATVVASTAPLYSTAVFVMGQVQIIVALGAETGGVQQPLLIRWCDQTDFTDWTASATNQAGSFALSTGSGLVGGLASGLFALLWTDQDLWVMSYLGFPLVFGFNIIAQRCGLIAQRAAGIIGSMVMWLGLHQFFQSNPAGAGAVPIECPVWDFYWTNVDLTQLGQIHCAVNTIYEEMAWFFPISMSSPLWNPLAPLGYIKFNVVEKVWDYGLSAQYQRTAWIPHSPAADPTGADLAGLLQQHEHSYDANGSAMQWSWQTGFFDLAEGDEYIFSDLLIPDFVTLGTNPVVVPTVLVADYPEAGASTAVVPQVSYQGSGTYFVTYAARGRQMAIGMSGADLGSFNRLGAIRVRYAPDGKS